VTLATSLVFLARVKHLICTLDSTVKAKTGPLNNNHGLTSVTLLAKRQERSSASKLLQARSARKTQTDWARHNLDKLTGLKLRISQYHYTNMNYQPYPGYDPNAQWQQQQQHYPMAPPPPQQQQQPLDPAMYKDYGYGTTARPGGPSNRHIHQAVCDLFEL
jgi:hypothetical protein